MAPARLMCGPRSEFSSLGNVVMAPAITISGGVRRHQLRRRHAGAAGGHVQLGEMRKGEELHPHST